MCQVCINISIVYYKHLFSVWWLDRFMCKMLNMKKKMRRKQCTSVTEQTHNMQTFGNKSNTWQNKTLFTLSLHFILSVCFRDGLHLMGSAAPTCYQLTDVHGVTRMAWSIFPRRALGCRLLTGTGRVIGSLMKIYRGRSAPIQGFVVYSHTHRYETYVTCCDFNHKGCFGNWLPHLRLFFFFWISLPFDLVSRIKLPWYDPSGLTGCKTSSVYLSLKLWYAFL